MIDWWRFLENVLSGIVLAIFAALLAILVTNRLAAERVAESVRRERNLATARDLYKVAGELFAAWKLWDFHGPENGVACDYRRRSEIVQLAASAEGFAESLILRIAQEHPMTDSRETALWCLRSAVKELRYSVRDNEKLAWWATDIHGDDGGYRGYVAYKRAMALVVTMLQNTGAEREKWRRYLFARKPSTPIGEQEEGKFKAIQRITNHRAPHPVQREAGDLKVNDWVLVAEQLRFE